MTSCIQRLRPKLLLQIPPKPLDHLLLGSPHPLIDLVLEPFRRVCGVHSICLGVHEGSSDFFDRGVLHDVFLVVVDGVVLHVAAVFELVVVVVVAEDFNVGAYGVET